MCMIPFFHKTKGVVNLFFFKPSKPRYAVAGRTTGVELGSHGLHCFRGRDFIMFAYFRRDIDVCSIIAVVLCTYLLHSYFFG